MKTVEQVRKENADLSTNIGDLFAVIVEYKVDEKRSTKGVQYWTKGMIKGVVKCNSKFIEFL